MSKTSTYLIFIISISILCFISFYPAFNFAFIVDDWFQLWGVFYDRSIIDYYILTQHPNSAYEFLVLAPIFNFNPIYYQITGFVLKIITSMSIALLAFTLTRSRKVAFFSALLSASSVIGIETFTRISAHNSALLIPLLCLTMHFWINATDKGGFNYQYLFAIFFVVLAIISDPGIGIIILPILLIWNLLKLLRNFNKIEFKKFILISILPLIILISLKWYLDPRIENRSQPFKEHILLISTNVSFTLNNFLTSIGNLMIGWIIPMEENMGLMTKNPISTIFGYLFLLYTLIIAYAFVRKKTIFLMISLLFCTWVFLFYFPSWFTQGHYVKLGTISAVSNRYLAIPSVGFIILVAYLVASLKRYSYVVVIMLIALNLVAGFRILSAESKYRSVEIQNKLYDRIDQDLPTGNEKNKLMLFIGNDPIKIFGIEWNGFYPLATKRKIFQKNDFPTIANNLEQVKKLVCKQKGKEFPDFMLSNLYAWATVPQSTTFESPITNVSEQVKSLIKSDSECQYN